MVPDRVSVVVPTYNAARYIRETLDSVLDQSYPEWELIVIDDGSTDDSPRIAREYLRDGRVRVVSQPNAGVAESRNRGLSLSQGEYVAFPDADDVWLPGNLEAKLAYLRAHPECALALSDVVEIDAASRPTGQIHLAGSGWVLEQQLLWKGDPMPALPSNAVIRRSALDDVGGFDPKLSTAADQDLKFRIAARYPVGRVPGAFVRYRVHDGNMHKDVARMEREHLAVYRKATELGLFRSRGFRRECLANVDLILAGSWWHSGRRGRALGFLLRSLWRRPSLLAEVGRKAVSPILSPRM